MKQARIWGFLPVFFMLALPCMGGVSQNGLDLGSDVSKVGTNADVPLTLDTTDQVQGGGARVGWTPSVGTGAALDEGPAIATADTVVKNIGASFMVLGVV